jgi:hypothetical protein
VDETGKWPTTGLKMSRSSGVSDVSLYMENATIVALLLYHDKYTKASDWKRGEKEYKSN